MKNLLIALAVLLPAGLAQAADLAYEVTFGSEPTVRLEAHDKCDGDRLLESRQQWGAQPVAKFHLVCRDQMVFGEVHVQRKAFRHLTGQGFDVEVPVIEYDIQSLKANLKPGETVVVGPSTEKPIVTVRLVP